MNRQLALKLVSKMQTNVWDLTDKQAEIILGFLESDNKRSELLSFLDWFKTKPELSEWNNDVILNLYKNDKKR